MLRRLVCALALLALACTSPATAGIHGHGSGGGGGGGSQTFSFLRGSLNGADGGTAFYNLATGTGSVSGDTYAGSSATYTPINGLTSHNTNPGLGTGQTWKLPGGASTMRPWANITYNGSAYYPAGIEKDVGFYLNPNNIPDYSGTGYGSNPFRLPSCTAAGVQAGSRPCLVDIWQAPIASNSASMTYNGVTVPAGTCYPNGCAGILPATCVRTTQTYTATPGTATYSMRQVTCNTNTNTGPANFVGLDFDSDCNTISGCVTSPITGTPGDSVYFNVFGSHDVVMDSVHFAYGPQAQANIDQADNLYFMTDSTGTHNFTLKNFEIDGLGPCTDGTGCIDGVNRSYFFRQVAGISLKNVGNTTIQNGAAIHTNERPFATAPNSTTAYSTLFQSVYVEGGCEQPFTGNFTTNLGAGPLQVPHVIPPNYPAAGQWAAGNSHCEVDEQMAVGGQVYNDVVVWTPRSSVGIWTGAQYCSNGLTRTYIANTCVFNPGVIITEQSSNVYGVAGVNNCGHGYTCDSLPPAIIGTSDTALYIGGGPVNTVDLENVLVDGTGVGAECVLNAGNAIQNAAFSVTSGVGGGVGSTGTVNITGFTGVGIYAGLDAAGESAEFIQTNWGANITSGASWPGGTGSYNFQVVTGTTPSSGSTAYIRPNPILTSATPTIATAPTPVSSVYSMTSGAKQYLVPGFSAVTGCP